MLMTMMKMTPKFRTEGASYDATKELLLRDENNTLRLKCAELEDAYSSLRSRCFSLEATSAPGCDASRGTCSSSFSQSQNGNHNHDYSPQYDSYYYPGQRNKHANTSRPRTSGNRRVAKENQDLISSLHQRNDMLQRDYSSLRHKHQNVLSNNGKLKKELQTLRLRHAGTSNNRCQSRTSTFPTSASYGSGTKQRTCSVREASQTNTCDDANELVQELEARLNDAEKQTKLYASSYDDVNGRNQESLVKELADATSKLHSMKVKYNQLEATCNECLDQLQQTKSELRMTRREKDRAEEEVTELRRQNSSLEEKITRLCCDAPFPTTILDAQEANTVLDPSPKKTGDDIDSSQQAKSLMDPCPIKTGDEAKSIASSVELDQELDEYADEDFE
mmetsp:Transcript_5504/g.11995  ORF Transcript_5504/g.11995 Transcript_5504/m.11995 type:complete len:391 (-) Transcript_5504:101-1273(-)